MFQYVQASQYRLFCNYLHTVQHVPRRFKVIQLILLFLHKITKTNVPKVASCRTKFEFSIVLSYDIHVPITSFSASNQLGKSCHYIYCLNCTLSRHPKFFPPQKKACQWKCHLAYIYKYIWTKMFTNMGYTLHWHHLQIAIHILFWRGSALASNEFSQPCEKSAKTQVDQSARLCSWIFLP